MTTQTHYNTTVNSIKQERGNHNWEGLLGVILAFKTGFEQQLNIRYIAGQIYILVYRHIYRHKTGVFVSPAIKQISGVEKLKGTQTCKTPLGCGILTLGCITIYSIEQTKMNIHMHHVSNILDISHRFSYQPPDWYLGTVLILVPRSVYYHGVRHNHINTT